MEAWQPLDRRTFLADMGKGAFALAVVSLRPHQFPGGKWCAADRGRSEAAASTSWGDCGGDDGGFGHGRRTRRHGSGDDGSLGDRGTDHADSSHSGWS